MTVLKGLILFALISFVLGLLRGKDRVESKILRGFAAAVLVIGVILALVVWLHEITFDNWLNLTFHTIVNSLLFSLPAVGLDAGQQIRKKIDAKRGKVKAFRLLR